MATPLSSSARAARVGLKRDSHASEHLVAKPCLRTQSQTKVHKRILPPLSARQIRRSPVITPDIVLGAGEEETAVGLMQYLLQQRIIYLGAYINDKVATQIVASLLALEKADPDEEIRLYINSPGGYPYAVFGIVDTMMQLKCPIQTVALGACYSYSTLVLAAGKRGSRYSMKNTRIMMTQTMGGSQGNWYQVEKTVQELNALYQMVCKYYMKFTDMTQDEVEMNTCRDYFMTPEEALQWNVIDDVITSHKDADITPPSVMRQLYDVGFYDTLVPGPYTMPQ